MRIAVNTRFLLKGKLEGIGRYTYEILKRIVHDHPQDQFFFFFDRPYDPSFVFAENIIPVVLFPPARLPILWKWWFDISVTRALKKYKADVFFSPDMFLSLKTSIPTLLVVHDLAFLHYPEYIPEKFNRFYTKYTKKYLDKAAHIMTVSEYTKKDIIKSYGISEDKITLAYNDASETFRPISTIDQEAIKKKYTHGKDYFFYLGAIHPRKNVEGLILAYNIFREQTENQQKLIIAGRKSWMTEAFDKILQESPYSKDIIVLGHIEGESHLLMGACSAFIYVSKFEGFGIPILEAIRANRPVICSNTSSMPEVGGDSAILVDPFNTIEIADAMKSAVTDQKRLDKLAEARKIQSEKFSWQKTAEAIYSQLENIGNN